jgi:hypothetical protein
MSIPENEPTRVAAPDDSYLLVSISKSRSPVGPDERDWHKYVISQGTNRIVGHRPGSPDEARRAVEELVLQLNSRRIVKPSRVHLTLSKKS